MRTLFLHIFLITISQIAWSQSAVPPSPDAQAIMKYLAGLSSQQDKRVISGQFENWGSEIEPLSSPRNYLNIVHQRTGKLVGLVGAEYHMGSQVIYKEANQLFIDHWKKGDPEVSTPAGPAI